MPYVSDAQIKKKKIKVDKKEMIEEHEKLIPMLRKGKFEREAKRQNEELQELKRRKWQRRKKKK